MQYILRVGVGIKKLLGFEEGAKREQGLKVLELRSKEEIPMLWKPKRA